MKKDKEKKISCNNCKHAVKQGKTIVCREPKTIKTIQEFLNKDAEEIDVTAVKEDGCEKFEEMKK